MLLRRITQHIKNENWFAVFIDFLIVVVGVFIGIQVANWNEGQSDARRFEQQLISFQEELETNHEILGQYKERAERQISEINELRSMFRGDLKQIDPECYNSLVFYLVAVPNYRPINAALNDLAESGRLRQISGTSLRQLILDYETHNNTLKRMDRDALNFRDQTFLPFLNSEFSYGAIASGGKTEFGDLLKTYGFAKSPFISDIGKAMQSQEFESHLTFVFAIEVEKIEATIKLQAAMEKLKTLLDEA